MNRLTRALALAVALTLAASGATASPPSSALPPGAADARAVVESLQAVLIECMKQADVLGFTGRAKRIESILAETFDLPFAARTGIGGSWKELSEQQKSEFIVLNQRLMSARYASNFNGYGGQSFEVHAVEPAARSTLIVRTSLVQPDDEDVRFDYRLRQGPAGWRVIDVVIQEAISEFVQWRGQYRSKIEREGYPQLVAAIEAKLEELSQK